MFSHCSFVGCLSALCLSALGLSGCAVHPLPENVTRYDTYDIVKHIRCEARERIAKKAIGFLAADPDPKTRQIAADLDNGTLTFARLDVERLDPYAKFFVKKYSAAAVAYDFTFDMTEDNDVSTQLDFLRTFTGGMFGAGAKAESDQMRETVRNFRISDTFGALLKGPLQCPADPPPGDLAYPITGTIGLKEVIDTFIDLNEFQNLTGKDEKDKVPTLADTFHFQTTISGSISPHVTLSPVTRGLSDAMLSASGKREDIHAVIVALALPPAKGDASTKRVAAGLISPGFALPTISARSPAEERAIDEIYNQITRNILFNTPQRAP